MKAEKKLKKAKLASKFGGQMGDVLGETVKTMLLLFPKLFYILF